MDERASSVGWLTGVSSLALAEDTLRFRHIERATRDNLGLHILPEEDEESYGD
jgi:hypothetical protein